MMSAKQLAKFLTLYVALSGCATARQTESAKDMGSDTNSELRGLIQSLSTRMDSLETKVTSTNDRVDATKASLETILGTGKAKIVPVSQGPSDFHTAELENTRSKPDPLNGFIQDLPIQAYRQALMLFQSEKYADSIISFSSFLERFPDHPLAGHAQYYAGEGYFKQKDYKLASREFQQVLTSYDRSPRLPDALRRLADCMEQNKDIESAAKQRQLLLGLFPQSPAAQFIAKNTKAHEPIKNEAYPIEKSEEKPEKKSPNTEPPALDSPPTAPLQEETTH